MKEANIDPRPEMKDHRTCKVTPESTGNLELQMLLSTVASVLVENSLSCTFMQATKPDVEMS